MRVLWICLGIYLLAGYLLGARHDYIAYQWHWQDILNGLDPWFQNGALTTNAYGPFHNTFALFYRLNPLLPKLSFIVIWFLVIFYSVKKLNWSVTQRPWVVAFFCFNPFFLIEFVSWGHHEAILASLIFFGAVFMERNKQILSGFCIGLGVLFKFLPVFLIPFFFFGNNSHRTRLNPRFLFACLFTIVVGYGIGFYIWGETVFYPIAFASRRPATLLSIFHFIQDSALPFFGVSDPRAADWVIVLLSKVCMIAGSVFVFLNYVKGSVSRTRAIAAEILTLLVFYQVGHPQFHSSVLFLLPYILSEENRDNTRTQFLKTFAIYAGFLVLLEVLFAGLGQYSKHTRMAFQVLTIPFFGVCLWTVRALLYGGVGKATSPVK